MSEELRLSIDLEEAVERGIIAEDQARALRNLEAWHRQVPLASEEPLGLSSVQDFMLCIPVGLAGLLVGALAYTAWWTLPFGLAGMVFLAEKLHPRTRLPLAKMLLFVMFAIEGTAPLRRYLEPGMSLQMLVGAAFTGIGVFWWLRYRQPVVIAAAVGAFAVLVHTFVGFLGFGLFLTFSLRLVLALAILALAVLFDITDIRRETTRSSVGAWLHVVAAISWVGAYMPQRMAIMTEFIVPFAPEQAVIALFPLLFAVIFDRRAWIIAALIANSASMSIASAFIGFAIVIFAAVSAFNWNGLRSRVLARLPLWLRAQLPRTDILMHGVRPTRRHTEYRPARLSGIGRGRQAIER